MESLCPNNAKVWICQGCKQPLYDPAWQEKILSEKATVLEVAWVVKTFPKMYEQIEKEEEAENEAKLDKIIEEASAAAAGPSAAASTAGHVHSMVHSRTRSRVPPPWWQRSQRSPGPENSETESE